MKDNFPPNPEYMELHNRRYEVRAFRKSADCVLLRGMVRDDKPHGLYLEDDTEPLTIHHMIVDIEISFPLMVIQSAQVVFESHPHTECTGIVNHYQGLVGLSIARGFTHKVRELFGGPRGCTHVTALLSAMAPVAIQCAWSMRIASAREDKSMNIPKEQMTPEQRENLFAMNLNTCHVWSEDGDTVATLRAGGEIEPPIPVMVRLKELGRSPDDWAKFRA